MSQLPVYGFSEKQIEKYKAHNLVNVDVGSMVPVPLSGCSVDASQLNDVCAPSYYWINKYGEKGPKVTIASGNVNKANIPEKHGKFDQEKRMDSLEIRIWYHFKRYEVNLAPVYR